jgi:acetoin utilization deacetylase AcuC-like enzyme
VRSIRRLARRVGPAALRVVFDERYGFAVPGVPLDPQRGSQVLAFLLHEGLVRPRDVQAPRRARFRNLLRAHTEAYLASLEDPAVVSGIVGAHVTDTQAAEVIELQRLVSGGTIQATRLALAHHRPVAQLGGGFHHAAPDRGMGFCALNDVAIAVRRLQAKGYRRPILVVDLDLHHGNGTRAVFADDRQVHTYSIHNASWDDRPAVASTDIVLGTGVEDTAYLDALQGTLPDIVRAHRPGLVIYIAGTDPAADDAMGDWRITPAGMLARDAFVVDEVRVIMGSRTPMVILLAGGYGFNSWRHTARFLAWLVSGRALEPPDDMVMALRRSRAVFARVNAEVAATTGEWGITGDDLFGPGAAERREPRLLDRYTLHGLELLFEKVGLLGHLRALGYTEPALELRESTGQGQTLRVYGAADQRHLLIEAVVRRDRRKVEGCEVLYCEWLLLQNPRLPFSARIPPLPGQQHPGLGLLGTMVALLLLMAEQIGLDGVANTPSHFHVAAVGRKHLRFVDPVVQARFEALADLFRGMSAVAAERALAAGRVLDDDGAVVRWEPAAMAIPVSARLRGRLTGGEYEAARSSARERLRFRLMGEGDSRGQRTGDR